MSTAIIDYNAYIWTCGNNEVGQLGLGKDYLGKNIDYFKQITDPDVMFVKVAFAYDFMVALDSDNTLWISGDRLMKHPKSVDKTKLERLTPYGSFVDFSCGAYHFVALDKKGHIWSHGENNYNQLGQKDSIGRKNLTRVRTTNKFKSISCGDNHTLALDINNDLWGFGDNQFKQLGISGIMSHFGIPRKVNVKMNIKSIHCSDDYSIILDSENKLWFSGASFLPMKRKLRRHNETVVRGFKLTALNIPTEIVTISTRSYHVLALDNNGDIWSVGANDCGQLGLGFASDEPEKSFKHLDLETKFRSITAGISSSFALDENNNLWACGSNQFGELGIDNNYENVTEFTQVLDYVNLLMDSNQEKKHNIKSA